MQPKVLTLTKQSESEVKQTSAPSKLRLDDARKTRIQNNKGANPLFLKLRRRGKEPSNEHSSEELRQVMNCERSTMDKPRRRSGGRSNTVSPTRNMRVRNNNTPADTRNGNVKRIVSLDRLDHLTSASPNRNKSSKNNATFSSNVRRGRQRYRGSDSKNVNLVTNESNNKRRSRSMDRTGHARSMSPTAIMPIKIVPNSKSRRGGRRGGDFDFNIPSDQNFKCNKRSVSLDRSDHLRSASPTTNKSNDIKNSNLIPKSKVKVSWSGKKNVTQWKRL